MEFTFLFLSRFSCLTVLHLDWHENLYPVANNELKLGEQLSSFLSFIKSLVINWKNSFMCFSICLALFLYLFPLVRPLSKFPLDMFAVPVRARELFWIPRLLHRRVEPFSLPNEKMKKWNRDFFTRSRIGDLPTNSRPDCSA